MAEADWQAVALSTADGMWSDIGELEEALRELLLIGACEIATYEDWADWANKARAFLEAPSILSAVQYERTLADGLAEALRDVYCQYLEDDGSNVGWRGRLKASVDEALAAYDAARAARNESGV